MANNDLDAYLELIGYSNDLCQNVYSVRADTPPIKRSEIDSLCHFVVTEVNGKEERGYVKYQP